MYNVFWIAPFVYVFYDHFSFAKLLEVFNWKMYKK